MPTISSRPTVDPNSVDMTKLWFAVDNLIGAPISQRAKVSDIANKHVRLKIAEDPETDLSGGAASANAPDASTWTNVANSIDGNVGNLTTSVSVAGKVSKLDVTLTPALAPSALTALRLVDLQNQNSNAVGEAWIDFLNANNAIIGSINIGGRLAGVAEDTPIPDDQQVFSLPQFPESVKKISICQQIGSGNHSALAFAELMIRASATGEYKSIVLEEFDANGTATGKYFFEDADWPDPDPGNTTFRDPDHVDCCTPSTSSAGEVLIDLGTQSGNVSIAYASGGARDRKMEATGDIDIDLPDPMVAPEGNYAITVKQDGTGGWNVIFNSTVLDDYASEPTVNTGAGKRTHFRLYNDGEAWFWI